VPFGVALQSAMRREVGASPRENPSTYGARSPIAHARAIAFSGVPLQIWWSRKDRIVFDQEHQSEAFFDELRRLNPRAPVSAYIGSWAHSKEMRASELLPIALAGFDLLPRATKPVPRSVRYEGAQSRTVRYLKRASHEAFLIATGVVRNVSRVLAAAE
jgi:hypothetical protein